MKLPVLLGVALGALLPLTAQAAPDQYTQVARGRELATAGDCVACHTAPGGTPFAGGLLLQTPFGGIATPNLTPDQATGLGNWTEDQFARAMHEGIGKDGEHLYPAFPYPAFTNLSRTDNDAIFAFLKTLPAVHNAVNRNTLPFPFNIRALMIGWNALYFTPSVFQPDTGKSAEYNQGKYLVEGAGHCSTCHTPMNWAGANKDASFLQGNNLGGWFAPNITNDNYVGLGNWSVDEIVTYLKNGATPYAMASGPMAEVIMDSTSKMSQADLHAIATYLKERGAAGPTPPTPVAASDAQMQMGAAVYADNCSACHTSDGKGVALMFPPLASNQVVQQGDPATVLRVIAAGTRAAATDGAVTAPAMPSFGWRLSDAQIAAVATYIRNSWGNAAPVVSESDAKKSRQQVAESP